MTDKLDLLKAHRLDYAQPREPTLLEIAPARYLAIDGVGGPGEQVFQDKVGGLYGMAYTLKFASKFAGRDYTVCRLETLYGLDGQDAADLAQLPREEWRWRMLIRVPDFLTDDDLVAAQTSLREKGKEGDSADVRFESLDEGSCVQILHVGPYDQETATIARMDAFREANDLEKHLSHHEIYLNDPRRIPPERLKTILRQPVRPR